MGFSIGFFIGFLRATPGVSLPRWRPVFDPGFYPGFLAVLPQGERGFYRGFYRVCTHLGAADSGDTVSVSDGAES